MAHALLALVAGCFASAQTPASEVPPSEAAPSEAPPHAAASTRPASASPEGPQGSQGDAPIAALPASDDHSARPTTEPTLTNFATRRVAELCTRVASDPERLADVDCGALSIVERSVDVQGTEGVVVDATSDTGYLWSVLSVVRVGQVRIYTLGEGWASGGGGQSLEGGTTIERVALGAPAHDELLVRFQAARGDSNSEQTRYRYVELAVVCSLDSGELRCGRWINRDQLETVRIESGTTTRRGASQELSFGGGQMRIRESGLPLWVEVDVQAELASPAHSMPFDRPLVQL